MVIDGARVGRSPKHYYLSETETDVSSVELERSVNAVH